jgi:hypothetical protein
VSRWLPADDQVLREMYADTLTRVIAEKLGRDIGTVYARAGLLGLKKSEAFHRSELSGRTQPGHRRVAGQFAKGHTSWNKGTHYEPGGRSAETRFGKGHKPHTWVPIGTETMRAGYLARKVTDDKTPSRLNWRFVHVLIWEAAHGVVPASHAVTFINGNSADIRLDNLEMVPRRELMNRNTLHNYGEEVASLYQLKGAITRQINKRAKRHEEQDRGSAQPPVCDTGSAAG